MIIYGFLAFLKGFPAIRPELDLVEQEDQCTHDMSFETELDPETNLSKFFFCFLQGHGLVS
jgi:hypothetical protein